MAQDTTKSFDEGLLGEFESSDLEGNDLEISLQSSNYVKFLADSSGLHVLQESRVQLAYATGHEQGLVHLFFTRHYLNVIFQWTNGRLKLSHTQHEYFRN